MEQFQRITVTKCVFALDIDDCAADPCDNSGTCTDGVDSYVCACVAGYTGGDCETGK